MGDDIYLNSIFAIEPDQGERPQQSAEASGYFRSSYNDGDVMWAMGLSWWGTVLPMLEEDRWLPVEKARELLAMIEERPLTNQRLTRHYSEHITSSVNQHPVTGPLEMVLAASVPKLSDGNTGLALPPEFFSPPDFEGWAQFLRKSRDELIAMLRKSIELDEPLVCSV
jgi:hypothetical protein